jgi:hypothetical protein
LIIEAKNKLESELTRLETLYYFSTILYKKETKAKFRESKAKQSDPVKFKAPGWEREIARNAGHFRVVVERVLPKTLRETIFVRMISAFEVFLTDVVRQLYASRRDLLRRDDHVELSYAKLASLNSASELITLLVSRDCRLLTGGGFREVEKYFRRKLNISLAALPEFAKLSELHDRRHLLTHRLGSVDDEYRHKYLFGQPRISVNEEYLLDAIRTIRVFSTALIAAVDTKAAESARPISLRDKADLVLLLDLFSPEAIQHVDPDFWFLYQERYFCLRDLLLERSHTETGISLRLRGKTGVIRAYRRKIKKLAEDQKLAIRAVKIRNLKRLTDDLLEKVRSELPRPPLPIDIHMAVAKKLGIKAETVFEAIRVLIWSGMLGTSHAAVPDLMSAASSGDSDALTSEE